MVALNWVSVNTQRVFKIEVRQQGSKGGVLYLLLVIGYIFSAVERVWHAFVISEVWCQTEHYVNNWKDYLKDRPSVITRKMDRQSNGGRRKSNSESESMDLKLNDKMVKFNMDENFTDESDGGSSVGGVKRRNARFSRTRWDFERTLNQVCHYSFFYHMLSLI